MKILYEICELVGIDEEAKKIACREVEGFLCLGERIFEEVIGQTFCNILNDQALNKAVIEQNTVATILENILNFKMEEELKVSSLTASKIVLCVDELLRIQWSKGKVNKNIFYSIANLISYFIANSTIYHLQSEEGPVYTKKLLIAIFSFLKQLGSID
jgi:hypothetical protein